MQIQLSITDLSGKTVFAQSCQPGANQGLQLNLHNLPAGMYLLQAQSPTHKQTQRITLQ